MKAVKAVWMPATVGNSKPSYVRSARLSAASALQLKRVAREAG